MPTKPQRFRRWWRQTCLVAVVWTVVSVALCTWWIAGHFRLIEAGVYLNQGGSAENVCTVRTWNNSGVFVVDITYDRLSVFRSEHDSNRFVDFKWTTFEPKVIRRTPGKSWIGQEWDLFQCGYDNASRFQRAGVFTPAWFPASIFSLLAFWCWRRWWKRRREPNHTCPACGYDLRASRDVCPECGRAIESRESTQHT